MIYHWDSAEESIINAIWRVVWTRK